MSSDLEEEKFRVAGKQAVKNLAGRLFSKKIPETLNPPFESPARACRNHIIEPIIKNPINPFAGPCDSIIIHKVSII